MSNPETDRTQVTVARGPYILEGPVTICDSDHAPIATPSDGPVALCRCGASADKPFCDGSHVTVAFDGAVNPTNRASS